MRLLQLVCLLTISLAILPAQAETSWQETYDTLLQKYATQKGVRYASWHANAEDRKRLDEITQAIAKTDLSKFDPQARLTFYLNAYNAWILKVMLDHYPTKSIKDTMYFVFRRNIITVAAKKTSFHALENEIIRKQFKEPRIHFALNCASASCPPLHSRAFAVDTLEETLALLTKDFVTKNPLGLRTLNSERELFASKIFEWYEEDFEKDAGSILGYLEKIREKPFPKGATLKFQDYDWSINEAR